MNVMLLAAGEGTRLHPHTLKLPKPAIPFLNIPLAAHSLSILGDLKIEQLTVNTYHLAEKIEATFKQLPLQAKQLNFVHEKNEILGSGGGLKNAQEFFNGASDLIMMNADEVILSKDSAVFEKAVAFHKEQKALATLIVTKHPGVGSQFGGVWCKNTEVLGFGKNAFPGSDHGWHFIGPQILNHKVFNYLPAGKASNILYDGLTQAITDGQKVQIFAIECEWFETGNEKDFLHATQLCVQHLFNKNWQGELLLKNLLRWQTPPQLIQTAKAQIVAHSTAQIAQPALFEGFVVIGAHTSVGPGTLIKNSCIGSDLQIQAQSQIVDSLYL